MLPDILRKQLPESIEAPVPNCKLSVLIRCNAFEIGNALEKEEGFEINRNADYIYPNPAMTGCNHFSTEEVKLYCNKKGDLVDYEIPYTDPRQNLSFLLHCFLIPYGSNPCLSPRPASKDADQYTRLGNEFDQLIYSVLMNQRSLLPPERIFFDGKELEVAGNCVCKNSSCVYFRGEPTLIKREQK